MNRRAFIAALGGATVWPLVARAQQAMPVVGFLRSPDDSANPVHVSRRLGLNWFR